MTIYHQEDLPYLLAILGSATITIASLTIFDWGLVAKITLPLTTIIILVLAINLHQMSAKKAFGRLIIAGLALSILGDILLQFSNISQNYFFAGLGFFLLAHIFYSFAFWSRKRFYKKDIIPLFIFVFFGTSIFQVLQTKLAAEYYPVLLYTIVICLMGWRSAAALYRREFSSGQRFLIFVGGLFFIASDSLLAVNRYISKLDNEPVWVLGTYFIAQTFFALSIYTKKRQ